MIKELKHYIWEHDDETRLIGIMDKGTGTIVYIDKIRLLSLIRFGLRVLAKPFKKRVCLKK